MKLAVSQQLFAYWNALRGARSAPERRDIDPASISGALADTFILDLQTGPGFPFRVVGSRTTATFDRELRLTPFVNIWREDDAAEIVRIIRGVADGAEPFLIGARGAPAGMRPIDLEVVLLPLRYGGATHARLLGACTPATVTGWLGILPIEPLAITSLRALRHSVLAAPFGQRIDKPKFQRRGHLFVYASENQSRLS